MSNRFEAWLGEGGTTPFLWGLAGAVMVFASILLHELGHAAVAKRSGIDLSDIELQILGGLGPMSREIDSPATELKVALAGPAVTLAIIVVLSVVGTLVIGWRDFWEAAAHEPGSSPSALMALVAWLATVNALILVIHLLPALPADGGHVARALIWWRTGDRNGATRLAGTLGRLFGCLMIGGGLFWTFNEQFVAGFILVIGGAFVGGFSSAAAHYATRRSRIAHRMLELPVSAVMKREAFGIPGDTAAGRALAEYFIRYGWSWFPVVDDADLPLGIVRRERIDNLPEASRDNTPISDLVEYDVRMLVIDSTPINALLRSDNLDRFTALIAVDAKGRLTGIITIDDVRRMIRDYPSSTMT